MKNIIGNHWDEILQPVFDSAKYHELERKLRRLYQTETIYPASNEIFTAFKLTDFNDVKVVILGQDPYHNENQAHGLSFSVKPGAKIPPSLRNIFRELVSDVGFNPVNHGYLVSWAMEGVLLLNTVLTVPDGLANGHAKLGWEIITDAAISALSKRGHVVFILWGNFAQKKIPLIDQKSNVILQSVHPSPLSASRGFFNTKPFSKANESLVGWGMKPINWQLPPLD